MAAQTFPINRNTYLNKVNTHLLFTTLFLVGNSSWFCSGGENISYFTSAQPDRSDCKGYLEILSICEVDTKFD